MDDLIKELDETLSLLEKSPDNVGLIRKQARVLKELSMDAEYLDTVLRLSTLVMLDEGAFGLGSSNGQVLGSTTSPELFQASCISIRSSKYWNDSSRLSAITSVSQVSPCS